MANSKMITYDKKYADIPVWRRYTLTRKTTNAD